MTNRAFDWVYTLGEEARATLAKRGITRTAVLPLGVDTALFNPEAGDPEYRAAFGLGGRGPVLAYAGRSDNEKRVGKLVGMFRLLPRGLDAAMMTIGDGKLRCPSRFPGSRPIGRALRGRWRLRTSTCRRWLTRRSVSR